jgi:ketosteroid isomerase-like protein
VKTNDAATIDRILADDFVLVVGADRTLDKSDVLRQAREKQAKYEHHEIEEGTQKVRVWRDTAVVTATLWVKGTENGKPVDHKVSVSDTYVRTPAGWRHVSGQVSTPTASN